MIKRNYFALFLLFLAASVTLTACDSNEAEDTEVTVEIVETITETTVDVSDQAVQDVVAEITTGALAAVVGDNVQVDNSAGAIVQSTSTATSTPSAGGAATTTTTSTTIAPLVNTTTGQPTGQVAVAITQTTTGQAAQTQNAIVTPNVSNTASISVPATSSTGNQSTATLNSAFDPASFTSTNSAWQNSRNELRQLVASGGGSFASQVSGNGQTYAERIQAAIAAGKRRSVETEVASYTVNVLTRMGVVVTVVQNSCSISSAVLRAAAPLGGVDIFLGCPEARGFPMFTLP